MFQNQQLRRLLMQSQLKQLQRQMRYNQQKRNFAVRQRKQSLFGSQHTPLYEHSQPEETAESDPFKYDSTFELIKKMYIYKLMGSNFFIDHSLNAMSLSYRVFGRRLTNTVIEKTASSIFTGGVTIDDMCKDMDTLEERNVGSISMMVVEGLTNAEEKTLDYFYTLSRDTIMRMSEGRSESHFAMKLTAYVSLEVMEKMSTAQKVLVHDILQLDYSKSDNEFLLSKEQLRANLAKLGITEFEEADFQQLCIKVSDSQGKMTPLARYKGGHLFDLYSPMTALEVQIAEAVGGMESNDFQKFEYFRERANSLTDYAAERGTSLYVDAEQTFIQYGIESFGQQMTHKYNRGDQCLIMNGYQCYTKRTRELIPMEVAAAKAFDYNLGVKLIRGAYMNEERELAAAQGVESPVWDSIEDTHKCYDDNLAHIITNMNEKDTILVASHNVDSVNLATSLVDDLGCKEDQRVRFGQLRGFSDQVTGQLAEDGYKVYKYVPFGPTEQVMPYLVRRGQESRQVLREQKFQNEVLRKEIAKRIFRL